MAVTAGKIDTSCRDLLTIQVKASRTQRSAKSQHVDISGGLGFALLKRLEYSVGAMDVLKQDGQTSKLLNRESLIHNQSWCPEE